MSGRLTRTDRAEQDLLAIWAYIARDNPAAADALLDDLDGASRDLAAFPSMGPARNDLGAGIRYFPVANYVIVYHQVTDGVEVIRYLHGHREIFDALTEPEPSGGPVVGSGD